MIGGEGLVLLFDLHAFFGFDRLVQAFRPPPALEDAAGELVDDLHLAVLDDVVLVALVQLFGLERRAQLVDEVLGDTVVEVLDAEGGSTFSMPGSSGATMRFSSSTS